LSLKATACNQLPAAFGATFHIATEMVYIACLVFYTTIMAMNANIEITGISFYNFAFFSTFANYQRGLVA
jgi:hypothetical protein